MRHPSLLRFSIASSLLLICGGLMAFDDQPVGARPHGLSGAFTALADDVHALYYNPAGLAYLSRAEVNFSYAQLNPDLSDNTKFSQSFLGYAQPLGSQGRYGALAGGYLDYKVSDLYSERAMQVGFGTALWGNALSGGLAVKSLDRQFGSNADTLNAIGSGNAADRTGQADPVFNSGNSAQAWGFDAGLLWRPSKKWAFGLSGIDINQPNIGLKTAESLPVTWRLGAAYRQKFLKAGFDLTRRESLDGQVDQRLLFGAERTWTFARYGEVSLRGGSGFGSREFRQLTAGFGYEVNGIGLDYVYRMPMGGLQETGNTHTLSLSFRFGKSPSSRELDSLVEQEREATRRAEEALRRAESESSSMRDDRTRLLKEIEELKRRLKSSPTTRTPVERAPTEKSQREIAREQYQLAFQAALSAYRQRAESANLVERQRMLKNILNKYQGKGISLDPVETELSRLEKDLAKVLGDFKTTWDFYKTSLSRGADDTERLSLLERMIKKYGASGIDLSNIYEELNKLKKN